MMPVMPKRAGAFLAPLVLLLLVTLAAAATSGGTAAAQDNLYVNALAFSPDGKELLCGQKSDLFGSAEGSGAAAIDTDGWLLLLEAQGPPTSLNKRSVLWRARLPEEVTAVAFLPGGDGFLAGLGDGSLEERDTRTGALKRRWRAYTRQYLAKPAVPETGAGPVVATKSSEEGHRGALRALALAVAPDGSVVVASGGRDGRVLLWDPKEHAPVRTLARLPRSLTSLAFSPDGSLLAGGCGDGKAYLWKVSTRTAPGRAAAPSATGGPSEAASPAQRALEGHRGDVWAVAFSPDGKLLASGGRDGSIRLWEVRTGQTLLLLRGHRRDVISLAFRPTASSAALLASGGRDGTARLWDAGSGACLRVLGGHPGAVRALAFSPDGKSLATGAHGTAIGLWHTDTGKQFGGFR